MNRLSKHDVHKLSTAKLRDKMPFELTSDGEVIAVVYDVHTTVKANHDVHTTKNITELAFSKRAQASGRLGR